MQELAKQVLFKPFQLVDVGRIPDEVLRDKVWVGLMEMCMKHVFTRDIIPYMEQELLAAFKQVDQAGGRDYLGMAFRYLLSAETQDPAAFVKVVKDELSAESGEIIMSIAQQLEAKAFEKGIEKGRAEGKREMQRILAVKLLEKGMDIPTLLSLVDELTLEEIQQLKRTKETSH